MSAPSPIGNTFARGSNRVIKCAQSFSAMLNSKPDPTQQPSESLYFCVEDTSEDWLKFLPLVMKSETTRKRRHLTQKMFPGGGWSWKSVEAGRHVVRTFPARKIG